MADTVIALDDYRPQDVTQQAKAIAATYQTERQAEGGTTFGTFSPRILSPDSIDASKGKRAVSLKSRATDEIRLGTQEIDLSAVEQLVESGQVKAIAAALVYAQDCYVDGQRSLAAVLDAVAADVETHGLDCLSDRLTGGICQLSPPRTGRCPQPPQNVEDFARAIVQRRPNLPLPKILRQISQVFWS